MFVQGHYQYIIQKNEEQQILFLKGRWSPLAVPRKKIQKGGRVQRVLTGSDGWDFSAFDELKFHWMGAVHKSPMVEPTAIPSVEQVERLVEEASERQYSLLNLVSWEKQIIWDSPSPNPSSNSSSNEQSLKIISSKPSKCLWGTLDLVFEKTNELPRLVVPRNVALMEGGKEERAWEVDANDEAQLFYSEREIKESLKYRKLCRAAWTQHSVEAVARFLPALVEGGIIGRLNFSQDRRYAVARQARVRQKNLGRAQLVHADAAILLQTALSYQSPQSLQFWHRPPLAGIPRGVAVALVPCSGNIRHRRRMKRATMADLSAREGRLIVAEYWEQFPVLLPLVGMAAKILYYYRKSSATDMPPKVPSDGEAAILEPGEDCPFMGEVRPAQTVAMFCSSLYKAPVVAHTVENTDFLLIVTKNADGTVVCAVREIDSLQVIGQLQPEAEVPAPTSRVANHLMHQRILSFLYRYVQSKMTAASSASDVPIYSGDIQAAFPSLPDTAVRKRIKMLAEYVRDNNAWMLRPGRLLPDEDALRAMMTPEMVCVYESMQATAHRLACLGMIDELTNNKGVALAIQQMEGPDVDLRREVADQIFRFLQLTSWNLTANFRAAVSGRSGQVQLSGFGDPSRCGAAYSYLHIPLKMQQLRAKKRPAAPKTAIYGSGSDIRALKSQDIKETLLSYGARLEVIGRMDRFELIKELQRYANAKAASSADGSTSLSSVEAAALSRFVRFKASANADEAEVAFLNSLATNYQRSVAEIFKRHLKLLGLARMDAELEYSTEDDDDESSPYYYDALSLSSSTNFLSSSVDSHVQDVIGTLEKKLLANQSDELALPDSHPSKSKESLYTSKRKAIEEEEDKAFKELQDYIASEEKDTIPASSTTNPNPTNSNDKKSKKNNISNNNNINTNNIINNNNNNTNIINNNNNNNKEVFRRLIRYTNELGELVEKYDIIRDQKKIEDLLKKREAKRVRDAEESGRNKAEEEIGIVFKRKKAMTPAAQERSLAQQAKAKAKREEKERQMAINGTLHHCSSCGQVGHLKSSKTCPNYVAPAPVTTATGELIKLKLSKNKLKSIAYNVMKFELPAKIVESRKRHWSDISEPSYFPRSSSTLSNPTEVHSIVHDVSSSSSSTGVWTEGIPSLNIDVAWDRISPDVMVVAQNKGRGNLAKWVDVIDRAILRPAMANVVFEPFVRPVTLPAYKKAIPNPMWLLKMQKNLEAHVYMSRERFMADVDLLVANCYAFNSTTLPELCAVAEDLKKFIIAMWEKRADDLKLLAYFFTHTVIEPIQKRSRTNSSATLPSPLSTSISLSSTITNTNMNILSTTLTTSHSMDLNDHHYDVSQMLEPSRINNNINNNINNINNNINNINNSNNNNGGKEHRKFSVKEYRKPSPVKNLVEIPKVSSLTISSTKKK